MQVLEVPRQTLTCEISDPKQSCALRRGRCRKDRAACWGRGIHCFITGFRAYILYMIHGSHNILQPEDYACLTAEGRSGGVLHDVVEDIEAALQRVALAQCGCIQLRQAVIRAPQPRPPAGRSRWPTAEHVQVPCTHREAECCFRQGDRTVSATSGRVGA